LAEIASVLKSKKCKAPEREEDGKRTSLNNEERISAFPTLVGVSDEDKIRNMMKGLNVDPSSLRDQQQLKDAAAAIASGTDPKQLHTTASGEPRDISGLNNLFAKNHSDRELCVTGDGQIVSRTMGSPDNRFLWTMKANGLIDSLPHNSEARKKAIIYRDSFGLMGEYFSWETVMSFDSHFRELIASGAPVDLTMNSIHSLFLLQNAAKTQFKSGEHEPASANKRFRGENQSDYSLTRASQDYSAKTKSKGYCTYFQKSNPEGGHKCRKQNCQFLHKCAKCSDSGHGAYACKKKKS
jgi:hypothetical protein